MHDADDVTATVNITCGGTQTTLLEDKIAEMKLDDFTDSSATRLEQLAKSATDAISYKRDLNIAASNLAWVP